MKTRTSILIGLGVLALLLLAGGTTAKAHGGWDAGVSFDVFYSNLSPYGEWVDVGYGQAWRPYHVGRGWRPYMYGRWLWTDYGWYWSSYEPYGWAVYHYGRWTYDDYYGWIWVPDDVWGPAWVEWRYNDDYIGWAPLSPYARFSINVGIEYSQRWYAPIHYWNFVPCRNFAAVRINEYVTPVERSRRFFGSTRPEVAIESRGDRVINRGVDPGFVERRGNIRLNRTEVVTTERERGERIVRGDRGTDRVEIYRPPMTGRGSDGRSKERRTGEGRPGSDRPGMNRGTERTTPAEVETGRNNSEGRSYNEMHGYGRRSEPRATEQPSPTPEKRIAPPAQRAPQIDRRQDDGRRSVETPERWRQRMPEPRQWQGGGRGDNRPEGRTFSQPDRGRQQQSAPEGRRGGRRP